MQPAGLPKDCPFVLRRSCSSSGRVCCQGSGKEGRISPPPFLLTFLLPLLSPTTKKLSSRQADLFISPSSISLEHKNISFSITSLCKITVRDSATPLSTLPLNWSSLRVHSALSYLSPSQHGAGCLRKRKIGRRWFLDCDDAHPPGKLRSNGSLWRSAQLHSSKRRFASVGASTRRYLFVHCHWKGTSW